MISRSGSLFLAVPVIFLACVIAPAASAGEFRNLDFEQAMVEPTPTGEMGGAVDPALAFPGWKTGTNGWGAHNFTLYNSYTLGSVAQVLVGPPFPIWSWRGMQGLYSAILMYGPADSLGNAALSQTGRIPEHARYVSLMFSGDPTNGLVTIDGVPVPMAKTPRGRLAGDISAYAGLEVELMISDADPIGADFRFDDVQFSSEMDPPPTPAHSVEPALRIRADIFYYEDFPEIAELSVIIEWQALSWLKYTVQYADAPTSTTWRDLTSPIVSQSGTYVHSEWFYNDEPRFFRLVVFR